MTPPTLAHAVLAHYFVSPGQPRMQGALPVEEFEAGLDAYGSRLIPAAEWIDRAVAGKTKDECCVTADDGLREQLLILPSLQKRGLTAAFSIYTGPLVGVPNNLERWRWLRNRGFGGVKKFYAAWFQLNLPNQFYLRVPDDYLGNRHYLSEQDRIFRFWRNEVADSLEYELVMTGLESDCPTMFDPTNHWLSMADIQDLRAAGHVIGFHTHSHPTNMARLSVEQQALEYATSKGMLELILEQPVTTGAHPCDSWTPEGIAWLQANGVRLMWGGTIHGDAPWHAPRWSTGEWRI